MSNDKVKCREELEDKRERRKLRMRDEKNDNKKSSWERKEKEKEKEMENNGEEKLDGFSNDDNCKEIGLVKNIDGKDNVSRTLYRNV